MANTNRKRPHFFSNGEFAYAGFLGGSDSDTWQSCHDVMAMLAELIGEHGARGLDLSPRATQGLADTLIAVQGAMKHQMDLIDYHNKLAHREAPHAVQA